MSTFDNSLSLEKTGRCCAITGSSGYLGGSMKQAFEAAGWDVIELCRNPSPQAVASGQASKFQLGQDPDADVLKRATALIHCAYDQRIRSWHDIREVNIKGTARLLAVAKSAGVERITVVSTMSAFPACKSLYGRAKLEIEDLSGQRSFIVRPGLIFGRDASGMVGKLVRYVNRASVAPAIGEGSLLYLTHADDLCRSVLDYSTHRFDACGEPVTTAHEHGWTLRQILEEIARAKQKRLRFIRLPWRLLWGCIRGCEALGINLSFRSDSVVSLINQNKTPSFRATRQLGLEFRCFSGSMIAT